MDLNIDIRLVFAILNGKVSTVISRRLHKDFIGAGLDLSPEQWTVLIYLSEQDGVSQQALCNATYKDKPSMTRLIDSMELTGWVSREKNLRDRRSNIINLTPLGRDITARAQKTALRTLKDMLKGLGLEELNICQEVLRRIFENAKTDESRQAAS